MKKLKLFGMTILALPLLFSLGGCSNDPPGNEPAQMIFQGSNAVLTIKDTLDFEVVFTAKTDVVPPTLFFSEGDKVSGIFTNREPSSAKWNENFVGTADIKSVTGAPLLVAMGKIPLAVEVEYVRNGSGTVTGLKMDITDANEMINQIGNNMLGGTYTLVEDEG